MTEPSVTVDLTPRVLHKGVYTLYEKPDGTLRIQYRRTDREEDDFMEIPGAILRLAKAASEGKLNPLEAVKMLRNHQATSG
jgi:hypothetical protein